MFKIWFIDDRLQPYLHHAVDRTLGRPMAYANWEVLGSATEAIRRFLKNNLPDIALIDMNFDISQEDETLVGLDKGSRGLIVATVLVNRSQVRPRYAIYTAYEHVREQYAALVNLPPALRDLKVSPLLQVLKKGNPSQSDVEAVLGWAQAEVRELARKYIVENGVAPDVCDRLANALVAMESAWQPVWEECQQDFRNHIRPKIDEIIQRWKDAKEDVREKNFLPIVRLDRSQSIGTVDYALYQARGEIVSEWISSIQGELRRFRERHRDALAMASASCQEEVDELTRNNAFHIVEWLFPFEAQALAGLGTPDPDVLIESLQGMLDILQRVDHHYALFRILKTQNIGGIAKPMTVFAAKVHNYEYWTDPRTGELVNIAEVTEEILKKETEVLPSYTVERMEHDGRKCSMGGLTATPLIKFAEYIGRERSGWAENPVAYLEKQLKGSNVPIDCSPSEFDPRINQDVMTDRKFLLLTDWRHFFDLETGVIAQVTKREKLVGELKKVNVDYEGDARNVAIKLSFSPTTHLGPFDYSNPRGGLHSFLKEKLFGWGRWIIHSSSPHTYWRTLLPAGVPEREDSREHAEPRFELEWQIRNYLRTGGHDETFTL